MFLSCMAINCKFNGYSTCINQLNHNVTLIVNAINADSLKVTLHDYDN